MAYHIKLGSLTVVVSSPQEALRVTERLDPRDGDSIMIHHTDGREIDVDRLREIVDLASRAN